MAYCAFDQDKLALTCDGKSKKKTWTDNGIKICSL